MKTIFKRIIFEKDGFAIIIDENKRVFKINLLHKAEDVLDIPIDVKADEVIDKKYGKQYQVKHYTILEEPLSFFLRKVVKSGLPKETITVLCEEYTLEEFKKILNSNINDKKLLKIKNLGKVRLEKIKKSFEEKKELIELTELLAQANITTNFLRIIYDFLKTGKAVIDNEKRTPTIKDLKEDPYILTQIDGIGFKKADQIALGIGIDELSEKRIIAYINYSITQITQNKGDTLHLKKDIFDIMIKELDFENKKEDALKVFNKSMNYLINKKQIIEINNNLLNDKNIYIEKNSFYFKEKFIADLIRNYKPDYWSNHLSEDKIRDFIKTHTEYDLSQKQTQAVIDFSVSKYPFFILAGYAGAGKTTTSKLIMDIYADIYGKDKIVATALSGNASNRIKNVSGYPAFTIHSLLRYDGQGFKYNEEETLPYKLIVLDEASMVDVNLFYALLKAINFNETKLFIVGDNAQLPPVGAGDVFSNMLEIKHIQKVILDKVFRQSEEQVINIFAQEIRKGIAPKNYKADIYKDFFFKTIEVNNYFHTVKGMKDKEKKELRDTINKKIKEYTIDMLSKAIYDRYLKSPKETIAQMLNDKNFNGFNKLTKKYIQFYQVIVPQRKYMLGTYELNKELKNIFNPQEETNKYNLNKLDKVIHLKNKNKRIFSLNEFEKIKSQIKKQIEEINAISSNKKDKIKEKTENIYHFLTALSAGEGENVTRVFNGQVGIIINTIEFVYENKKYYYTAVYYPNEDYIVMYDDMEMENKIIDLSYAFTIHKSQGSEYNIVALPMSFSNAFMLNNKLLYTAITRAKNKLFIIGESYAFNFGIKKKDEIKRKTYLEFIFKK